MVRTKQTARKSTGPNAPRRCLEARASRLALAAEASGEGVRSYRYNEDEVAAARIAEAIEDGWDPDEGSLESWFAAQRAQRDRDSNSESVASTSRGCSTDLEEGELRPAKRVRMDEPKEEPKLVHKRLDPAMEQTPELRHLVTRVIESEKALQLASTEMRLSGFRYGSQMDAAAAEKTNTKIPAWGSLNDVEELEPVTHLFVPATIGGVSFFRSLLDEVEAAVSHWQAAMSTSRAANAALAKYQADHPVASTSGAAPVASTSEAAASTSGPVVSTSGVVYDIPDTPSGPKPVEEAATGAQPEAPEVLVNPQPRVAIKPEEENAERAGNAEEAESSELQRTVRFASAAEEIKPRALEETAEEGIVPEIKAEEEERIMPEVKREESAQVEPVVQPAAPARGQARGPLTGTGMLWKQAIGSLSR